MKLKLNQTLHAALAACYSVALPVATTVSSGAIITGVAVYTMSSHAQAAASYEYTAGGTYADPTIDLTGTTIIAEDALGTIILGAEASSESVSGSTTTKFTGTYTVDVGTGTTISDDIEVGLAGGTFTVTGGGTYEIEQLLMSTTASTTTLNVEADTTLYIKGSDNSTNSGAYYRAFCLANWGVTTAGTPYNTLNINGTLIADAAMHVRDGSALVNVGANGTFQLNSGLAASTNSAKTITMNVDGTLVLGESASASDSIVTVYMNDGSTIQSNGVATTTAVLNTLTYKAEATITFAGADNGNSLSMSTAVTGTDISAIIEGNVIFAGGADLATLTLSDDAALTISSAATIDSLVGNFTEDEDSATLNITGSTAIVSIDSADFDGTINLSSGANLSIAGDIDTITYTSSDTLTLSGTTTVDAVAAGAGKSIAVAADSTVSINGGASAAAVTGDGDHMTKFAGNYTVTVASDSTLSDGSKLALGTGTFTVTGGGTYELTQLQLSYSSGSTTTLDVDDNTTLHITGSNASSISNAYDAAFCLGNWTATNIITVDGTLIVDDSLYLKDGSAKITVGENGILALAEGLDASRHSDGSGTITTTVNGTLLLGDSSAANTIVSVTMNDGSTIQANGEADVTTVLNTLTYEDEAEITFAGADNGNSLSMSTAVTGTDISAIIEGNVIFAGGADLDALTLSDAAALTISNGATIDSVSMAEAATASLAISGGSVALGTVDVSTLSITGDTTTITGNSNIATLKLTYDSSSLFIASGETTVGYLGLSASGVGATSLEVSKGATLKVTDTLSLSWWKSDSSYINTNDVDIYGTLISDAYLSSNDGESLVTVYDGGTLQLNQGLIGTHISSSDSSFHGESAIQIVVEDGATLVLGNQTDVTIGTKSYAADYDYSCTTLSYTNNSSGASVSSLLLDMESGSKMMDNGVADTTTVYQSISYASDVTSGAAEINFESSGEGKTLILDKQVAAQTVSGGTSTSTFTINEAVSLTANITGEGAVQFDGGANLAAITIAEPSTLIVNSSVSTNSVSGAGAITVTAEGALTMGSSTTYTGDIALNGGTLTVAGELNNALTVGADSNLASSTTGLALNSAITITDADYSLDLTGANTVTIGEYFSLSLDYSVTTGDYVVFTNASNDFSSSLTTDNYSIAGGFSEDYDYVWSLSSSSLTLTVSEATQDVVIDTGDGTDKSYEADTAKELGSLTVIGDNTTSLTGVGSITSETITKKGSGDLFVATTVSSDDITLSDGAVKIEKDGSLSSGNITVTAAEGQTASLTQADADTAATLKANTLTSAEVEKAVVTVTGAASLVDTSIDADSSLVVKEGKLSLDSTSTVEADTTIEAGASLGSSDLTVTGNTDGATLVLEEGGSITSNSITGATISGATVTIGSGVILKGSTFTAEEYTSTIINSTVKSDATVEIAADASLGMNNVIIEDGATLTGEATSSLTAIDVSITASTEEGSLSIGVDGSYTINTLVNAAGSITLGGTLNVSLNLTEEQYQAFVTAIYGSEDDAALESISFTIAGTDALKELTAATIALISTSIVDGEEQTQYIVLNASDAGSLETGTLVFSVSEADVIPEPSTSALSLLALAGLLARRKRRASEE